jgi:hypothetical protein
MMRFAKKQVRLLLPRADLWSLEYLNEQTENQKLNVKICYR